MCAPFSQVTEWDPDWPGLCHVQHVVSQVTLALASRWQMGEKRDSLEKADTLLNLDLAWIGRHMFSLPISLRWKLITYLQGMLESVVWAAFLWSNSVHGRETSLGTTDFLLARKELKIIAPLTLGKCLRIPCNTCSGLPLSAGKMECFYFRPNMFVQQADGPLWERESSS